MGEQMTSVTKKVLVAEDDRFLRRASVAALRSAGYTVIEAADGEQAIRAAKAESPDLILLDLLMPIFSGLEVLHAIRAEDGTRDTPVIILSNSSRAEDIVEGQKLGVIKYLVKADISLQELRDIVKEVFLE